MKTQQRSFVVEIKSKGRRSAVQQGSIWGSTDLKAVARQAASVAPQLFDEEQPAEPTVGDIAVAPAVENASVADPVLVPMVETSATIAAITVPIDEERSDAQHPVTVDVIEKTATVVRKPRQSRATGRKAQTTLPRDKVSPSTASQVAAVSDVSIDELPALEAENLRLKALLADRLRKQNLQLKMMLHRFGAA